MTSRRPTTRSALRAPGLDWVLMVAVGLLVVVGTLLVWSATSSREDLTGGDPTAYLKKQLVNVAIGLVLMVMVMATDHRWVRILAPVAYLASVAGLVMVLVAGTTINGSRSWIQLGALSIQPSELAKLAVVIGMALLVAERTEGRWGRRVRTPEVVGMLAIAGLPAALILAQPDLGTMLVLTATVFGVLAIAGAGRAWLAGLTLAGLGTAVVA
ncbi:MAG TPA: FtsW/RodA/SpoVE family cell cycle protein, partial [Nocardioides sp.]